MSRGRPAAGSLPRKAAPVPLRATASDVLVAASGLSGPRAA